MIESHGTKNSAALIIQSTARRYATELAWRYVMLDMKTIEEIRVVRLRMLIKEVGSTAALNRLAERNERDSTLSQILNGALGSKTSKPKTMGSDLARTLEAATGKPRGWMDNDPDLQPSSWPFVSLTQERFNALPDRWQGRAEERMLAVVEEWERDHKSTPRDRPTGTHA
ncbi:hypothetical protein [Achromobacter insolitus]|uniref:hypothetical protein n=1 Tax=Achromobacter insolitus TaxID=217204 RepID=UPI0020A50FAE|nr:hypothetical protein [Achromobacter insolitus]MCP1404604.1 hypothetical protein [Achromobacter insolitus]